MSAMVDRLDRQLFSLDSFMMHDSLDYNRLHQIHGDSWRFMEIHGDSWRFRFNMVQPVLMVLLGFAVVL